MSPSQNSISTTNFSPPTLFPTTCMTQGMESPFIAHSPSDLSTPLQRFQHSLDKKSLCWDLKNSTSATQIHLTTKCLLPLKNFEQNVTHSYTTYFSMKFQLQIATKLARNKFLQDLTLKNPLLSKTLHVKQLSMQKHEYLILVSSPYKFPLFLFLSWLALFPKMIILSSHALNNYGKWLSHPLSYMNLMIGL